MSLFQKSVEKKYLNGLDTALIDQKFNDFQRYFGNVEIQENIRNSKEEEFQEGFIRELFVNILDYTLKPQPDYNIVLEKKNVDDSKKADGAILRNENAIAVIELKSTSTTDLGNVETQAFGYKNHHPNCTYIITSNFEKIRFYIQNAVDYLEFDLFKLNKEQFCLLWLCLAKDNILNDLPLRIKESSVIQEEGITKQLYADYSKFREEIFESILENNKDVQPTIDPLILFKKTQKLLDRFLFIFFTEDKGLLPPNTITEIVNQWTELKENYDEEFSLYSRFIKFFGYMNTGYKGNKYDLFPYNGGLFLPDEILDNIKIDDEILKKNTLKLTTYDFETDIDVNILGHIFEHSLSEIENMQAKLRGEEIDKKKTKRKKDGIFYTPKYITKYIVENTIGKLCDEKRNELKIIDEEYAKGRKHRKKDILKNLDEKLTEYRNWLLSLTILDPACGSGAFLNQALEFLINEHRKIDELKAQLLGGEIVFSDITTDILEKNIFGVDINEESVEIAKLSLWLRTAQKGRKLNTLSNNIKCGNSLIDDPEVAGDKAFNWQKEFPNIFPKKDKKAWHITWATHNSRYSQRMFDNYVKLGEPVLLSEKEEQIVTETIAEIVKKDELNVLAYNICQDHVHLLLVCEETKVPAITQKLKSMSSRACNIAMGRTIPQTTAMEHTSVQNDDTHITPTMEHTPVQNDDTHITPTMEHAPLLDDDTHIALTREHAPLESAPLESAPVDSTSVGRGTTQFQLWTQKYDCKAVYNDQHFNNTIDYIYGNRKKHGLPDFNINNSNINNKISNNTNNNTNNSKGACSLADYIAKMLCIPQHAFRTEYKGGFDVVIGNPPYVDMRSMKRDDIVYFKSNFKTASNRVNLFGLFVEKSFHLLKNLGEYGMIIHRNLIRSNEYEKCRDLILNNTELNSILSFKNGIFDGVTGEMTVLTFSKNKDLNKDNDVKIFNYEKNITESISKSIINQSSFNKCLGKRFNVYLTKSKSKVLDKITEGVIDLSEISYTLQGIIAGDEKKYISNNRETENHVPIIRGRDIERYKAVKPYEYIYYIEGTKVLTRSRKRENFEYPIKILTQHVSGGINAHIDTDMLFYMQTINGTIITDNNFSPYFIQSLLNSKLIGFYYDNIFNIGAEFTTAVAIENLDLIPIKNIPTIEQQPFIEKADQMLTLNKQVQEKKAKFLNRVKDNLFTNNIGVDPNVENASIIKISKKLENFYDYDFKTFVAELKKQKINLSLKQQDEWEEYFTSYKTEINQLQSEISKTDNEIDQMVYELYGLTEDEIKIVEGE